MIEQKKWKSIFGGGLKLSVVMKKQSGHKETLTQREGGRLPASENRYLTPEHTRTHTLLHMTIYIRERREEGGTAQRELALPRTDAHLTHCTGSQSAFHCTLLAARTSLCLIVKKK